MRTFNKKLKRLALCLLLTAFSFSLASFAQAQTRESPQIKFLTKRVKGEVSAITKSFIAVVYSRKKGADLEMALPVAEDAKIVHKKSIQEIQVGDIVEVQYEDKEEKSRLRKEDGSLEDISKVVKREAKVITFIKRPKQGLYSGERSEE